MYSTYLRSASVMMFLSSIPQDDSSSQLELLLRRAEIQLVRPQCRLLFSQPQVRLAHRISRHVLSSTSVFVVCVGNTAIGDRMLDSNRQNGDKFSEERARTYHDVYAFGRHLSSKSLSKLANTAA